MVSGSFTENTCFQSLYLMGNKHYLGFKNVLANPMGTLSMQGVFFMLCFFDIKQNK